MFLLLRHFVLGLVNPLAFDFAESIFERFGQFHATLADDVNRLDLLRAVFADGYFDFLRGFGSL